MYGDVTGFQTEVAERMGKPCFECSLYFSGVICVAESGGLLKSQHPARACFRKHPSQIPIQEAESEKGITNNTVSSGRSVDSALKAPDYVVY